MEGRCVYWGGCGGGGGTLPRLMMPWALLAAPKPRLCPSHRPALCLSRPPRPAWGEGSAAASLQRRQPAALPPPPAPAPAPLPRPPRRELHPPPRKKAEGPGGRRLSLRLRGRPSPDVVAHCISIKQSIPDMECGADG